MPVLFVSFINDLQDTVSGLIKIFVDNSKINSSVEDNEHYQMMTCIDFAIAWSKKWEMSFTTSKCKVPHLCDNNENIRYSMFDTQDNYV